METNDAHEARNPAELATPCDGILMNNEPKKIKTST
jgi:hypothetical protein